MPIKIPYPPGDKDERPHRQAVRCGGPTQISRFSADAHVVPDDVKRGDGHPESALRKELAGGDDADESDLSCQGEGMDGPCLFFFGVLVVVGGQYDISYRLCRFGRHV